MVYKFLVDGDVVNNYGNIIGVLEILDSAFLCFTSNVAVEPMIVAQFIKQLSKAISES